MKMAEEPWDFTIVLEETERRGALYLSGADFAASEEMLKKHKIKRIISAALVTYLSYTLVPKMPELQHLELNLFDQPQLVPADMSKIFERSFYFIEDGLNKKENVLVHCIAGVSRSATIVLSYLMRHKNWALPQSIDFLKQKRTQIHPNRGFLKALKQYEFELSQPAKF